MNPTVLKPDCELKHRLASGGPLLRLIGAHDALGALLAEEAGFDGVWASSLEICTSCGRADDDTQLMSLVLPAARSMASATRLPVVADCGTGGASGAEISALVRAFETAGVAAVCLEDARRPKSNVLFGRAHAVVAADAFARKIAAAKRARRSSQFVVIARTEALIAELGIAEAISRARKYSAAGADAILIHSRRETPDEVFAFIDAWDGDAPLVLVPTTYSSIHVRDVRLARKVRMLIYANQGLRAAIRATRSVMSRIREDGTAGNVEADIATLDEVRSLQNSFATRSPGDAPSGAVLRPNVLPSDALGALKGTGSCAPAF